MDDEIFSDDIGRSNLSTSYILNYPDNNEQQVCYFEVRVGGEVRVEFTLNGRIEDTSGNVKITGDVKLFEGVSDSTNDLDGQRNFTLYVPSYGNAQSSHYIRINNDDEGGDYATILVTVNNSPV